MNKKRVDEQPQMPDVTALAEKIMRLCQGEGYSEAETAFACVLAAACLGGDENKKPLMSFFADVVDSNAEANR